LDDPYPSSFLFILLQGSSATFYILGGLALALLLLTSAMVSGSEVAFFSLTRQEIASCKNSPKQSKKIIYVLISDPKKLLATILIFNNFVNVAFVTLATFITWRIVGTNTLEGTIIVLLTLITTFAIVFFGEVIPKVYASPNSLQFAGRTARLLMISQTIFKPLSWFLMNTTNIIEKRIEKKDYQVSKEELHKALELTAGGETTEEEKEILKGIVNFGTLTVKQVMKSRLDITAFDIETDFHALMDRINKWGYSRIPIFRETIDRIEGILYIKDLLPYLDKDENFNWQSLLRTGYFVPENKKIDSLLKDFQEKRVHMAIVVDEYGGTSGLITLEDIIEEIVGEIRDEFDDDEIAYNKLDDNTYVFESKTSLNDFCKILGIDPVIFEEVKGESESMGGLLLEISSKLPRVGEKIEYKNFVFTVVAVDNRRIKRIRVLIKSPVLKKNDLTPGK
jgi:putative hemolysin